MCVFVFVLLYYVQGNINKNVKSICYCHEHICDMCMCIIKWELLIVLFTFNQ